MLGTPSQSNIGVRVKLKVPLHLSGFWCPNYGRSPASTGSVGAGVTLAPPLTADLACGGQPLLNGRVIPRDGVNAVLRLVPKTSALGVKASAPADLGEGLGVSAALLTALSASALISAGVKPCEGMLKHACRVAHEVEVTGKTGLGDVIAEFVGGGLVVRIKPGPPGVGEAYSVRVRDSFKVIAVRLGNLITPSMLEEYAGRIAVCGRLALSRFLRNPTLEAFLNQSLWFSVETGMFGKYAWVVRELLNPLVRRGCILGYFLKKSLLAVFADRGCLREVERIVGEACARKVLPCAGRVKVLVPAVERATVLRT